MRLYMIVLMGMAGLAFGQSGKDQLNIALLKPISTLNPYYNEGIESESITNLLFDAVYVETATGTDASLAKIVDGASPGTLKRTLEMQSRYFKWMPDLRSAVTPEDVRFSYYYLNANKLADNTHSDKYIRGFRLLNEDRFEVLLRASTDTKTLKQQLNFKIIPSRSAIEHVALFNKKTGAFVDSEDYQQAGELINTKDHHFLSLSDLLTPWHEDVLYNERYPGVLQLLLNRRDVRKYPGLLFRNLNLADAAYTFYVYKYLFGLEQTSGVADIEPVNNGFAATLYLDPDKTLADVNLDGLFKMPLVFRFMDPNMANTRRYWGSPQSGYKFSVEEKGSDFISLQRERSRIQGRDRTQFSVQKVRLTLQAGNDIASLRSGFQSGATDMVLNIFPSWEKRLSGESIDVLPVKGSQIEMLALNCVPKINGKANPLADARVRLALNYALDKDELFLDFAPNYSELMHGPLTSADTRGALGKTKLANDRQKAAELLREAGFSKKDGRWLDQSGRPMELKLVYEKVLESRDKNLLLEIAFQLEQFGITISNPRNASLATVDFYDELKHRKTWQLALLKIYQSSNTDIDMYNPDSPAKNIFNFKPEAANHVIMSDLFRNYSISRDQRRREIKQQLARLIRDEAPAVFLWDFQARYLVNTSTLVINNNNSPSSFNILQFVDDYLLTK